MSFVRPGEVFCFGLIFGHSLALETGHLICVIISPGRNISGAGKAEGLFRGSGGADRAQDTWMQRRLWLPWGWVSWGWQCP